MSWHIISSPDSCHGILFPLRTVFAASMAEPIVCTLYSLQTYDDINALSATAAAAAAYYHHHNHHHHHHHCLQTRRHSTPNRVVIVHSSTSTKTAGISSTALCTLPICVVFLVLSHNLYNEPTESILLWLIYIKHWRTCQQNTNIHLQKQSTTTIENLFDLRYFAHPGFFVILILMYVFIVLVPF